MTQEKIDAIKAGLLLAGLSAGAGVVSAAGYYGTWKLMEWLENKIDDFRRKKAERKKALAILEEMGDES